ncbi:MAG: carbamoyl-phosphate synthase (glutamine-hydrolyzing) large subunit [Candidatus Helarchaeota archaeon]
MPLYDHIKKVLILGSGAIRIGQAGEFDYSGSQCVKAVSEEGIETILINPNIATIQTDPRLADKVYLLPITVPFVEKVIKKERPDGIMLAFGGQTALNCGVELNSKGILEKYEVDVLGTPIKAIEETENRELFRQAMFRCGIEIAKSKIANNLHDALKIANDIGYPIIVRVGYTLGGRGSGIARNEDQLREIASRGLAQSMINQILIEEYLDVPNWKEVEYEVVRDSQNNCITVCNMENFDPMGIHTGESIVIAPSQTLTNREYHILRSASIRVIRELGIVGECNIQYGLHARSEQFKAIEVNARLSRSSALASKATGYPLAYVAAKLALGYTLPELSNKVTGITTACFEPALDYLVTKIPRWDLQKFSGSVDRRIGSQMKSVGEVMAIGRNFEESIQKAIRMLEIGKIGLSGNSNNFDDYSDDKIKTLLKNPTDERIFVLMSALRHDISVDEIYQLTGIDKWFLYKLLHISEIEKKLKKNKLFSSYNDSIHDDSKQMKLKELIKEAKKYGFSDLQIAKLWNTDEFAVRRLRTRLNITPVIKQIDTLAAEWPATTNYLYLTYGGNTHDLEFKHDFMRKKIIVLGSGVYRIGSSVEFDWGAVNIVWALKNQGIDEVAMVNYNPETVSTDYDISDKLYFEEINFERVLDICDIEKPYGIVVSVGGQVSNNIAPKITMAREILRIGNVKIIGTLGKNIDRAENRVKFSKVLDLEKIGQPDWSSLSDLEHAKKFAKKVGYPVLVRPSYVLSGAAMRVAYAKNQLEEYLLLATNVSPEHPVIISKYIEDAREVEVDGVSDGTDVLIGAIIEHVENAGVHSGDATMSIPPISISKEVIDEIKKYSKKIARSLQIVGPFNIQYIVKNEEVFVIECNLRTSRSMPFVSKTSGINLMEVAAPIMLGKKLKDLKLPDINPIDYFGVKVPQFSFMRLEGADPILGVEMLSTGEVASYGNTFLEALIKALISAEIKVPLDGGNVFITVGGYELKQKIIPLVEKLTKLNYKIYATEDTAIAIKNKGFKVTTLYKISEPQRKPNIKDYLLKRKIDLIINIPIARVLEKYKAMLKDEYDIRRKAVEYNIPVITNLQLAKAMVDALEFARTNELSILSLNELWQRLDFTYGWNKIK